MSTYKRESQDGFLTGWSQRSQSTNLWTLMPNLDPGRMVQPGVHGSYLIVTCSVSCGWIETGYNTFYSSSLF